MPHSLTARISSLKSHWSKIFWLAVIVSHCTAVFAFSLLRLVTSDTVSHNTHILLSPRANELRRSSTFWCSDLGTCIYLFITPYGIIQVMGSLVDRKDRIQGVIDRDRLFCLLGELISHAEEEMSGPRAFRKRPQPTVRQYPLSTKAWTNSVFWPQSPLLDEERSQRGHWSCLSVLFSQSLSFSPQYFRVYLRSLACPVLEKTVCASCDILIIGSFRS